MTTMVHKTGNLPEIDSEDGCTQTHQTECTYLLGSYQRLLQFFLPYAFGKICQMPSELYFSGRNTQFS